MDAAAIARTGGEGMLVATGVTVIVPTFNERDNVRELVARTASALDVTVPFQIDDYTRWRLMEGLDDIGLTLQHESEITEFEASRAAWRPKTLPAKHLPPVEIEAARPVS